MAIARINSDQDFSKLKPGARLRISGRLFELQGTLGEGAMGKIFRATSGNIELAVKFILEKFYLANQTTSQARFRRSALISLSLPAHRGIVATFDEGVLDGIRFVAMELVKTPTLQKQLEKGLRVSWRQTRRSILELLEVLITIHSLGVTHRDIHPTNLFRTEGDEIRLFDWSASCLTVDAQVQDFKDPRFMQVNRNLTRHDDVVGHMGYAAPEANPSTIVTAKTDIFPTAILIHRLAHGVNPFKAARGEDIQKKIRTEEPLLLNTPGVPRKLKDIISQGLSKRPEQRQNAMEMYMQIARL
ncbi:MAG: serine/threonine-protein kinase [Candidatus Micrarchaeota archaeon]